MKKSFTTRLKKILAFVTVLVLASQVFSQVKNPIRWNISTRHVSANQYEILGEALVPHPWHLYSYDIGEGGPVPTSLVLTSKNGILLDGGLSANIKPVTVFDSMFMMQLRYFVKPVVFSQKITVQRTPATVSGYFEYMVCDNTQCLPPEQEPFSLEIKTPGSSATPAPVATVTALPPAGIDTAPGSIASSIVAGNRDSGITRSAISPPTPTTTPATRSNHSETVSLWLVFLGGLLGGLLAVVTPCVFPMIPLTVSFFMKRGKKKNETWNVLLYGLSIIVIYVGLGFLVTLIFGPDAMNALSTSPWFNVFFFFLLVVFAASFLGAFEIQLPASWSNYFDSRADSTSGIISIFFMAFTLGMVSFSCTGPIIGTLLVEAATTGSKIGPLVGMLGFSLALALPFTLFAFFPSWMQRLPKSGGWLNSVKVVLGFLELALALKFLSTADLAAHWGILPRETFLVLWIIIFALLGFYLLGKLTFAHDSKVEHVTVTRLFLAIISFSFSLYMVPGLWGAPLKAISAFSPPQSTQDFDLMTANCPDVPRYMKPKKYGELFHSPLNLNSFFDYDEGMAYAREVGKPVMLDFTGHGCVNCRKMEVSVWSDKRVLEILAKQYVIISFYVDDRTLLPDSEQVEVMYGDRKKRLMTIGNKWSYLQASKFGTNSQPYYVLLDNDGNQLTPPSAFDLNVDNYISFLERGLSAYTSYKNQYHPR